MLCADDEEKLSLQRSVAVTLLWAFLMMFFCWYFGEQFQIDNMEYYALNWNALTGVVYALIINTVLFNGNIVYYLFHADDEESLARKISQKWAVQPISTFKVYVVAPAYEEATFSVLLYAAFKNLGLESNLYFSLITSICFGLSHIHMKWDILKEIVKDPKTSSWVARIRKCTAEVSGIVLITTIFCLYSKVIFLKTLSFWPCFILHAACNILGSPITGFNNAILHHVGGSIACICLMIFF